MIAYLLFALVVGSIFWSERADADPIVLEADRLETDLEGKDIVVEGNVKLSGQRFRLRTQRAHIKRAENGIIEIDGPVELSPCPCESPPIAFDVQKVTIRVSENSWQTATFRDVRIKLGPVTTPRLPWFQLRSPSTWGLLPPKIAWRGSDGPLLGLGVHVPIAENTAIQLQPSLYLLGGFDLSGNFLTPSSRTLVRWDSREERSLVQLDSLGNFSISRGLVSWDIDAIRGTRARSATIGIEPAARPYDSANAGVTTNLGGSRSLYFSSWYRASAYRGEGTVSQSPKMALATTLVSNRIATLSTTIEMGAHSHAFNTNTTSVIRADSQFQAATWLGPVELRGAVRAEGGSWQLDQSSQLQRGILARSGLFIPLVREYSETTTHKITPHLEGIAMAKNADPSAVFFWGNPSADTAAPNAAQWFSMVNLGSQSNLRFGENRWDTQAHAAIVFDNKVTPVGRHTEMVGSRYMRVAGEVAVSLPEGATANGYGSGLLSLGRSDSVHWDNRVQAMTTHAPISARYLDSTTPIFVVSSPWLTTSGTSVFSWLSIPFTQRLTLSGGAMMALPEEKVLSKNIQLDYADSCGCVRAQLLVSQRIGREGIDALMSVLLAP